MKPLCAACRHPAVRQRPRGCAAVEESQGDPRLPARAAERSRQEHQRRARRIRARTATRLVTVRCMVALGKADIEQAARHPNL